MGKQRNSLLVLLLGLLASCTTAPLKNHLVRFYPISQAQYDSILRMTAGQPVISESRLINKSSSLSTLTDFRTAISSDLTNDLQQLLHSTGLRPVNDTKTAPQKVDGYPLCVIKANDDDNLQNEADYDPNLTQGRSYKNNNNDDDEDDESAEIMGRSEGDDSAENQPVVNCIVVVKKPNEEAEQHHYADYAEPQHYAEPHNTEVRQKETYNEEPNPQALRTPNPYYYPPYVPYPAYPFYNYGPYAYLQGRNTKNTEITALNPTQYATEARSSKKNKIKAESTGKSTGRSGYPGYYTGAFGGNYRNGSKKDNKKADLTGKSTGRSGYPGYYPGAFGGNYGYYYPQMNPYSVAGYGGGCQNTYNPYAQLVYNSGNYPRQSNDDDNYDSGEESGETGSSSAEFD